jgi:hypothetical protein
MDNWVVDSLPVRDNRGAASTSADQIGKVFVVVGQDVRRCLICDGTFTRLGAGEHAKVVCMPGRRFRNGRSHFRLKTRRFRRALPVVSGEN